MLDTDFTYKTEEISYQRTSEVEIKQQLELTYSAILIKSFEAAIRPLNQSAHYPLGQTFYSFKANKVGDNPADILVVICTRVIAMCDILKKNTIECTNNQLTKTVWHASTVDKIMEFFVYKIFKNILVCYSFNNLAILQKKYIQITKEKALSVDTGKKLIKQCKKITQNLIAEIADQSGISVLNHRFRVSDAELIAHGVNVQEYRMKKTQFDCYRYALFFLREEKVEKWIYSIKDEQLSGLSLLQLSYTPVQIPQKNDLIVYVDDTMNTTHFGIFYDSQMVQSKWGKIPQIFLHPINIVPTSYGTIYQILRKID